MTFITTQEELTQCDREKIHQIAAIQQFGAMIVVNADWIVTNRSLNCGEYLGLSQVPKPGTDLSDWFKEQAIGILHSAHQNISGPDEVQRLFGIQLNDDGARFDCAVHKSAQSIIMEFELHDEDEFVNHISQISPMIAQLEPIRDEAQLCEKAARLVRHLLGCDRVMVYKFRPDECGEVIAEEAREDLEPYLGLRYPRTDIPQQARELFRRNRVRVIRNVEAEFSPVEPAVTFGNNPLDLSMSVLRGHSKMHLEYLANMGVGATLAIAIVRGGKLWGMISCHHSTPYLPSFSLRTVTESFGQMFSLILDRILIDRSEQVRSRARALHDELMINLADGASLAQNVMAIAKKMEDLIDHDGLTVHVAGEFIAHGDAPSEEEFRSIAPELASARFASAFGITRLADHIRDAEPFNDKASGTLIIPITREPDDYMIFWRRPLTKSVLWAGDPAKAKTVTPDERLQPRESFAAWEESVEGHSADWSDDDLHIAEGLRTTLLEVILRMSKEVSKERSRAQQQQELLISELNHRVRNILNLIRGLVSQSQHDALNVDSFASIIGGRIAALAAAHENITEENWEPAPLYRLFESEIEAYLTGKQDRFSIDGEPVRIKPEAYTVLALVVHELITNSAKYGSLCDRSGSITVNVSRTMSGDLKIEWREHGGPPVQSPTRRGFGSTIIERSVPYELKGEADLRFKLTGLEADFVIPAHYIIGPTKTEKLTKKAKLADSFERSPMPEIGKTVSRPGNVLVVEDSMIIALDTEENLKRLGVGSVAVASSVSGALKAIDARCPDFALVDFNLGAESSQPVMEKLRALGVPYALATGYAELKNSLEELGAVTILRKPYGRAEIANLLDNYASLAPTPAEPTDSHAIN